MSKSTSTSAFFPLNNAISELGLQNFQTYGATQKNINK